MENEIWKDVPGYDGYYQVSNYGHVKSKYGSMRIAEEKTSISRVTIRKYINKNKPYKNILFYESKNNNS